MCLQSLLRFGSQGHLACLVHFLNVLYTQAKFIDEGFWEIARLEFDMVIELHILGRRILLPIQIYHFISYLECLSWQADTTLHIVLSTVNRTPTYFSIFLRIKANILATQLVDAVEVLTLFQLCHIPKLRLSACLLLVKSCTKSVAHGIVFGLVSDIADDGVACGIVEHDDIVELDRLGSHSLVLPLWPLDVALASERKCVLAERHMKRRLRHSWTVAHLAYEQIVTYEQTFLERA